MRKLINLVEDAPQTFAFALAWDEPVTSDAYRSRGRGGLMPIRREHNLLRFGPFMMGGYEVDDGYDKVKGWISDKFGRTGETFASVEEARIKIEGMALARLRGQ